MRTQGVLTLGIALSLASVSAWRHTRTAEAKPRPVVKGTVTIERELSFLLERSRRNPGSFQTWAQLGSIYAKLARTTGESSYYQKAQAAAERSLHEFPKPNPAARLVLAQVSAAHHKFDDAIAIAKQVAAETTHPLGAGTVLVTSYLAKGKHQEASREVERLIEVKPSLGTYSLRALVMGAMGRVPEAIEDFNNALRVEDIGEEDESAWVRALYARQLMRIGQYASAERALDSALELRPGYHLALDLKGQIALLKGDSVKAEQSFGGALRESMQVVYVARQARAKIAKGERAAGLELLKQAEAMSRSELNSGSYGHRLELAKILIYRSKLDTALSASLLSEAERLAHEELAVRATTDTWLTYARACRLAGNTPEAARAVREALMSSSDAEVLHEASLIEQALSNPRRAAFFARRALEANPEFSPDRSVEL